MSDRGQTPVPVTPGMVLGERWRLDATLGTGGMAEVFRATDLVSKRTVAVKVLRSSLESSPEAVQRFRREGELLVRLKNAAIVGAEAVEALPDGRLYIVMELLEGETLGARLKRGTMTAAELAPIVAGCAVALAAAHAAGVVHRDLKPDNIFLARMSDGSVQVKLLDFGVSKVWNGEKLTQTGQVLGTPRYMSPEQLGAEPEVDHRVDVYSLGVILYEALGGRSPFLASTPTDLIVAILNGKTVPLRSVRPDVPAALEAVVMRAIAKVRDARHRAATELAEAFFAAAGIDNRSRPAQRHGMSTSPMGAMRASGEAALEDGITDAAGGALKLGTFSSFEAIDMKRVLESEAAASALAAAIAPAATGARNDRATVAAKPGVGAPKPIDPTPVAGMGHAATALAPPRDVVREPERASIPGTPRAIPMTAMSPVMVAAEVTPAPTPRRDPSGHVSRRDGTGTEPVGLSPPGRISRSSSASIAGASAPRSFPEPEPRSQGLLLVVVGLVAGGLTAGLVVAVLTWVTQMRGTEPRIPPPPPPRATSVVDAGPATDAPPSTAAATGVIVPSSSGTGSSSGTTTGASSGATTGASSGATTTSSSGATTASSSGGTSSGGPPSGGSGGSSSGATTSSGGSASGGSSGASASSSSGGRGSSGGSHGGSGGSSSGATSSSSSSGGGSSSSSGGSSSGGSSSGGSSSGGSSSGGSSSGGSSSGGSSGGGSSGGGAATIDEAAAAARRGDYAECVDIMDDVIGRSPSAAGYRRRADCELAMGEIREATRDYCRLLRTVPDSPAASGIRPILLTMGASCD